MCEHYFQNSSLVRDRRHVPFISRYRLLNKVPFIRSKVVPGKSITLPCSLVRSPASICEKNLTFTYWMSQKGSRCRAYSVCRALTVWTRLGETKRWRKFGPARRVTLPSKGEPARGITRLQSSQIFVPHVKGSSSFVRNYKKVWLSQSRSGWRLPLQQLPAGMRFLHINGV